MQIQKGKNFEILKICSEMAESFQKITLLANEFDSKLKSNILNQFELKLALFSLFHCPFITNIKKLLPDTTNENQLHIVVLFIVSFSSTMFHKYCDNVGSLLSLFHF